MLNAADTQNTKHRYGRLNCEYFFLVFFFFILFCCRPLMNSKFAPRLLYDCVNVRELSHEYASRHCSSYRRLRIREFVDGDDDVFVLFFFRLTVFSFVCVFEITKIA